MPLPIYNFKWIALTPYERALAAAGMNTRAPKTNAWIQKKALEIGLEGSHFVGALAYAGNEDWLADAPRRGSTCLTRVGEVIARR
jgi:hypothetical protein